MARTMVALLMSRADSMGPRKVRATEREVRMYLQRNIAEDTLHDLAAQLCLGEQCAISDDFIDSLCDRLIDL